MKLEHSRKHLNYVLTIARYSTWTKVNKEFDYNVSPVGISNQIFLFAIVNQAIRRNELLFLIARIHEIEDHWEVTYTGLGVWDKNADQEALCKCGHTYHRHFDTYDDMRDIGCKYCQCMTFDKA